MADNVAITAGAGTDIAADDIGSVWYQRVKLSLGADGSATDLVGTAARGAYIDPRPLVAATSVTPTISTSAYAAGDSVGGQMTFSAIVRANGGTGRIIKVVVTDDDQELANFDLALFHTTVAGTTTDNAAFDPTDADLHNCVGVIPISSGSYASFTDNAVSTTVVDLPFTTAGGADDLFGVLVIRAAHTYTATSDLSVTLVIQQD